MSLRATRILLASGVLFAAVLALTSSTAVTPGAGFVPDGDVIGHVDPGSPTWRAGIRAGDHISVLDPNADGGWQMVAGGRTTTLATWVEALRRYIPWSIAGLGIAVLGSLFAFRGHPAAAPVMPLALEVITQPLFFTGSLPGTVLAGASVFLGGALAVVVFAPWRRWLAAVLAAGSLLAAAWVVAIFLIPAWFDALEWARLPAAAGFSLAGLVAVVDRQRIRDMLREGAGMGFVDIAYVAVAIGGLAIAGLIVRIETEYLAVIAIVAITIYPIWRRNAIAAFDRFVTSRARRDAAILAIEEERGRLARDIHDAPLQDLSGVIRRLDAVPGAEHEAAALREVAARLRDVATQLRPPVLQDLGLVAAIEDLRDQLLATHPGWVVVVEIDDLTSRRRPPADVELAGLRVIQEAAANAVAHSDGRRFAIRGTVATSAIELTASDDGGGYPEERARIARRGGHFGLDSMRERAEAVGAETIVVNRSDGVSVQFRWVARS